MELNKFFQSKLAVKIAIAVVLAAALLSVFAAGVYIGYRKAQFSYSWAENYDRNFGGPQRGVLGVFGGGGPMASGSQGLFRDPGMMGGHGIFGTIISLDDDSATVKGADNKEKVVLVSDDTSIEKQNNSIKITDLKIDDQVVIIGSPDNQGRITAKFIRVLPGQPPIQN
ncbi:MAG: hypothetical protein ABR875_01860 [Minisyncoccia bacterium]|jgi:hypothetical protein